MATIFTPDLQQTTAIAVPSCLLASSSTARVVVRFRATLDLEKHAELERAGGRVQLWSDIPTDSEGRVSGEWSAATFERAGTPIEESQNEQALHLSLSNDAAEPQPNVTEGGQSTGSELSGKVHLALDLTATLDTADVRAGNSRFSFTYRIAYPAGGFEWLGAFGKNGGLVFTPDGDVLDSCWRDARGLGIGAMAETDVDGGERAIWAFQNPSAYSVWGVSREGEFTVRRDASLVILAPRSQFESLIDQPLLSLSAGGDATLFLNDNGVQIIVSGRGSVRLHVLHGDQSTVQASLDEALVYSRLTLTRTHVTPTAIFLASSFRSSSIRALVLPRSTTYGTDGRMTRVNAGVDWFQTIFNERGDSSSALPICLSSLDGGASCILEHSARDIVLGVASTGSLFTLAVAQARVGEKEASAPSQSEDLLILPTPPPSPPAQLLPSLNRLGADEASTIQSDTSFSEADLENEYYSPPAAAVDSWLSPDFASSPALSSTTAATSVATVKSSDSISTMNPATTTTPSAPGTSTAEVARSTSDGSGSTLRDRRRPHIHQLSPTIMGLGLARDPSTLAQLGSPTKETSSGSSGSGAVLPRPVRERAVAACFAVVFAFARMMFCGGVFARVFKVVFGGVAPVTRTQRGEVGAGSGKDGAGRENLQRSKTEPGPSGGEEKSTPLAQASLSAS
ncbi:hypothetical protein HGRIS_007585 [Hohenbuehelia grisea]|uniref:Uncharacterized protein n=1 Tax=Hohenbuehelia grisea TaxID=104357 RepID=A0ABR3J5B2_9AGAR